MKIGDTASVTRSFDPDALDGYHRLAGGPTGASDRVPEPLIGGLFSYLLGAELPGHGTNYLKQTLNFTGEAPVGEPLTATVTVTRTRPEKDLVDLETVCRRADGTTVCEGRALVLVKDVGRRDCGAAADNEQQQAN